MSETAITVNEQKEMANKAKYEVSMWNDKDALSQAYKAAQFLSESDLVPKDTYKGKPGNCLIALDVANRTGMSPLAIMQSLYVVQGKPVWSGQMCIALVNGCGRFTPLSFRWQGEHGQKEWSCTAVATRILDGVLCESSPVSWQMALDEGWVNKNGSKWKTMPAQMMTYRAGAFFARVYCPDVLLGIYTKDEMEDVYGPATAPERAKKTITIETNDEVIEAEAEVVE